VSASENGWQPAQVGADACEWITVPGTGVSLQIQKGQPLALLRAFAADFNAYVEPLRDADSACWTPTNSVATSNHLNATACDFNWNSHPFRVSYAGFDQAKIATVRELLDFYEDTIHWGQDWGGNPYDAMHFQVGYDTYQNPHTADFIARKIRADGYSTFRRGAAPVSKSDQYAQAIIREGQRRGVTPRGIQIALATALVESNMRMYANSSVPESLNLPHDAVGSDHDSVGLFQQRCPMWGPANVLMDPTQSAGLFYDHLERLDYNDPDETPGYWAQAVQRSAFPDRYDQRFGDAVALYDRLSNVTQEDDFMSALSDAEQREMLDLLRQQSGYRRVSRSPLRHVGEGPTETATGFELNVDGSVHTLLVQSLARLGDPDALALLNEVANLDPNRYPDRAHDRQLAAAILNDITGQATASTAPASGQTPGVIPAPPAVIPTPIPAAIPPQPALPPAAPVIPPVTAEGGLLGEIVALTNKLHDVSQQVTAIVEG